MMSLLAVVLVLHGVRDDRIESRLDAVGIQSCLYCKAAAAASRSVFVRNITPAKKILL